MTFPEEAFSTSAVPLPTPPVSRCWAGDPAPAPPARPAGMTLTLGVLSSGRRGVQVTKQLGLEPPLSPAAAPRDTQAGGPPSLLGLLVLGVHLQMVFLKGAGSGQRDLGAATVLPTPRHRGTRGRA